jgi:DNA-binding response OmpR family regulator
VTRILIVEDDLMIADMVEELLIDHGYEVCGIARTIAGAVALSRLHKPAIVLVDMRLADGGLGTDLPMQLSFLGRIGVLYLTGNVSLVMKTASAGDACLAKPYRPADLLRALELVIELVATGLAPPPYPRGFQKLRPDLSSKGEASA